MAGRLFNSAATTKVVSKKIARSRSPVTPGVCGDDVDFSSVTSGASRAIKKTFSVHKEQCEQIRDNVNEAFKEQG